MSIIVFGASCSCLYSGAVRVDDLKYNNDDTNIHNMETLDIIYRAVSVFLFHFKLITIQSLRVFVEESIRDIDFSTLTCHI